MEKATSIERVTASGKHLVDYHKQDCARSLNESNAAMSLWSSGLLRLYLHLTDRSRVEFNKFVFTLM